MASPLLLAAVLLLASKATAGPSLLEWLSGFQYVPPVGWTAVTSDPACQHCTTGQGRNFFGFLAPLPCCPKCPKCGVERSQRIVGGTEATPGMYPWIAALKHAGFEVGGCAATLVSADWAVTAAHCILYPPNRPTPVNQSQMTIILGEHTITTPNDEFDTNRKEVALAMDPIIHPKWVALDPNWTGLTFDYDIALLKLAESVDLGVHTPACLPAATDDFTGGTTKASVYGWGKTDPCSPSGSPTLREAEVTITTNAACRAVSTTYKLCNGTSAPISGAKVITDRMLCAVTAGIFGCQADKGGPITEECRQAICYGDSGGPLTVESSGQHTLAGVVSFSAPGQCGSPGIPGVYANVANLRSWVDTTIAANGGTGALCDG